MDKKISELFDYGDEIVIAWQDASCDPAEIKELTMQRISGENKTRISSRAATKRLRRTSRMILIAAVIAVLLAGTALAAYYTSTMRDHALTQEPLQYAVDGSATYQYSPVGMNTEAEGSDETHFLAGSDEQRTVSAASSKNAEFQAMQEWNEYYFSEHEADYDVLLPQDDPARLYGIGWKAVAEKLRGVAEKYGLRLYQSEEVFNSLDAFYGAIGVEAFAELSGSHIEPILDDCVAMVYDEGSFRLNAVSVPVSAVSGEDSIAINIDRDRKGTMSGALLLGDAPELYVYQSYTTAKGVAVDLALGDRYSLIFCELDGCWVTVSVNGGYRENMPYLPTIDMAVMEKIADCIDFAALDISQYMPMTAILPQ